jgi:hypothetical protein
MSRSLVAAVLAGFVGVACGSSDNSGGGATISGGTAGRLAQAGVGGTLGGSTARGGASAGNGATAGGGAANTGGNGGGAPSTGGRANTGGRSTGGVATTGGVAGAAGASGIDQTCQEVCDLLATTSLTCVPNPCLGTCVTKYNNVQAANATCGADYRALLECGATQPASSWECYPIPLTSTSIAVPQHAQGDPCYSQFQALYNAVLANFATCGTALAQ